MGTGGLGVRVDDGHPDVGQHLPALEETDGVGSSSLQDRYSVHAQGSLVNVHRGRLWMLSTLRRG